MPHEYKIVVEEKKERVSLPALLNVVGGVRGARDLISGKLTVVPTSSDFMVRVDHAEPLPQDYKEVHPHLHPSEGFTEFDLRNDVEPWSFPGQGLGGGVVGGAIYSYLLGEDLLRHEFGFAELRALAAVPPRVAQKLPLERVFFGWRSVSEDSRALRLGLLVPCLILPTLSGRRPTVKWFAVGNVSLGPSDCNLRFRRPFVQTE